MKLYAIFFLICTVIASHAYAQEVSDYSALTLEDYNNITLPPLDSLFENAKNGPNYQLSQVKTEIERRLLVKEKRAVLGFFSLRGSYQYGMFGTESSFTDVATYPYLSYSTNAQNGYTVGAAINIPIEGLFDLKARVNRQKLNLKSAQLEKEIRYEEMKREIIELYSTATSQLNVLRLRAESLELARLQYEIAEKDFINGAITSSSLSIEKGRHSTAAEAFERSRYELTRSLMVLEIITRTPILRK